jgi:hypothetical protein
MGAQYWSFRRSKISSKSLLGRKDFLATADSVTSENIPSQVGVHAGPIGTVQFDPAAGNVAKCPNGFTPLNFGCVLLLLHGTYVP